MKKIYFINSYSRGYQLLKILINSANIPNQLNDFKVHGLDFNMTVTSIKETVVKKKPLHFKLYVCA